MLQPGETFGEYKIVALIGSGGQGDVFRVCDRLGLEWALKVSHEFTFDSAGAEARFHQEAQWVSKALRGLPRDCGVFVGEHYGIEARRFYAKMRLLTGESLAARLRRVGRFSLRETLMFGEQVARAVSAAHRAGALHRDLKPENVFIEGDGKVQVLDWGCLQVIEAGRAGTTGSGPICTPGYAGLEQYQGGRAELQASTDVYSLGVMLYEVIAGCHPFLAWARGPRLEAEDDASPPSVDAVLTHFPVRAQSAVNEEVNTSRGVAGLDVATSTELASKQSRWGVGDECVTMPADFGRRAGHFDQAGMLRLLRQEDTLVPSRGAVLQDAVLKHAVLQHAVLQGAGRADGEATPGGRLLRAEDLPKNVPELLSREWPSQAHREIRHPSPAQLANQVVVPQHGVGGRPRQPSPPAATQRVTLLGVGASRFPRRASVGESIEVTSFEPSELGAESLGAESLGAESLGAESLGAESLGAESLGAEFSEAALSAEQSTASLSELQRAGRVIPEGLHRAKPSTFEQARQLAELWNVPSTHTAQQAAVDAAGAPEGGASEVSAVATGGSPKLAPRPRKFSTPEVIRLQLRVRPRPIDGIPDRLWELIEGMLAKHPERRPQSMEAVADALCGLLAQLEARKDVELNSVTADQSQATWQHLRASLQRLDRDEASAERRQKLGRAVMLVCGGAAAVGVLVLTQTHPNRSVAGEPSALATLNVAAQVIPEGGVENAAGAAPSSPVRSLDAIAGEPAAQAPLQGEQLPTQSSPQGLASGAESSASLGKSKRSLALSSEVIAKGARKSKRASEEPNPDKAATPAPRSALLMTPVLGSSTVTTAKNASAGRGANWIPEGFSRLTPEQERAQVQYLSGEPASSAPAPSNRRGKP